MARARHHTTTRRKERVDLPLGFGAKLRSTRRGREHVREKDTRLVRVLLVISYIGL
jgi:hypothetical protein